MTIKSHGCRKLPAGQLAAREPIFARFDALIAPAGYSARSITSWEEHC
ncbi:hypothetical protein H8A99_01680 [Bradyrhizobium sp. Arg68]|nr:hypothetical protein [Bradyrhizobium ivorense]MCC8935244.1 hypothetical protein [Bradyrhizobium ivorense]